MRTEQVTIKTYVTDAESGKRQRDDAGELVTASETVMMQFADSIADCISLEGGNDADVVSAYNAARKIALSAPIRQRLSKGLTQSPEEQAAREIARAAKAGALSVERIEALLELVRSRQ